MKQLVIFCALFAAAILTATAAETFTGTLIDVQCKDNELTTHPRKCAISCAKYGYGLKESDGSFLKFDEQGNVRALTALKRSTRVQNLKASVTGTFEDGVLKVDSLVIR
jgi:hypothetical protein